MDTIFMNSGNSKSHVLILKFTSKLDLLNFSKYNKITFLFCCKSDQVNPEQVFYADFTYMFHWIC